MALGLLWLGLALLGALQTQAQDSTPNPTPAPPLLRVPLQSDFQNEKFQGKWYVLGLAGNEFNKEKHSQLKMYTATYVLNEDNSYNVTSTVVWDQNCDHWTKIFIPNLHLGQFNLSNIERYTGTQNYTTRVVTTNYNQFAILYFKKVFNNQEYIKVTLYGRNKDLPSVLKEVFISFAKSLGLTEDHIIFLTPIDECMDK
ncbi:neutrophil gelatinase-associated lipocalin-like isoform X3 [Panthera pardus]|uniref:Neutrophil gelatinase-associated lipocalin-like isoform X3 n=1 Tax=Panthera pardus TaxID=9691 RepID=A0A9V1E8R8_PANPR|nr:neutrophil gelatinase-associated lipocalin-like isoform X3 [Panthera pardus]XP_019276537.1 neutrophil gelatinase-associated lipocalin-like isoform X3 [Panthera pardus]XP_042767770.1 neutrophil gelatinase-associated lipocalin-like [Panthera leo]XP_042767771.1 neutrophil gelatinase-associated lipocalin-like [Panthera leo]